MLKSNISEKGKLHDNKEGTPQGGVISPLLANVALTDFDNYITMKYGTISYHGGKHLISPMIRYADDFVILCKSKTQAEKIKEDITNYLSTTVGLTLSDEKTRITHIKKGFNFLGFTFKKYPKLGIKNPKDISDYTMLITPQRESLINLLRKCKEVLSKGKTIKQENLIRILNPILRGWGNYYRHVNSKLTFNKVDYAMWHKTQKWSRRRHRNKNDKWIKDKYFTQKGKGKSRYFEIDGLQLIRLTNTPIQRHIKVIRGKRVYNKDDVSYWEKRNKKQIYRSLYYNQLRLYKKQKENCPQCNSPFMLEDKLHIHHIIPKALGGTDSQSNLSLLHAECHRDLHKDVMP
jgi:RNA-directed DNA polymerase